MCESLVMGGILLNEHRLRREEKHENNTQIAHTLRALQLVVADYIFIFHNKLQVQIYIK